MTLDDYRELMAFYGLELWEEAATFLIHERHNRREYTYISAGLTDDTHIHIRLEGIQIYKGLLKETSREEFSKQIEHFIRCVYD